MLRARVAPPLYPAAAVLGLCCLPIALIGLDLAIPLLLEATAAVLGLCLIPLGGLGGLTELTNILLCSPLAAITEAGDDFGLFSALCDLVLFGGTYSVLRVPCKLVSLS